MHPRTKAMLEELEKANWFSQVGTMYGVKQSCEVIILASWQEAIEQCSSIEWENAILEAQNQYCERLCERSTERFNQWNEVDVWAVIVQICGTKVHDRVWFSRRLVTTLRADCSI